MIVIGLIIVIGFGLRLAGLGRIGFAEDEINQLDAVRAYDRGDFTANAEHPMLMKAMIDRYYTEKFGRTDLQSRVLSDPKFTLSEIATAYVILQRGPHVF